MNHNMPAKFEYAGLVSSTKLDMTIPDFILGSKTIHDTVSFDYLGTRISNIPPLSQGYGYVSADVQHEFVANLVRLLVRSNKTVVLEEASQELLQRASSFADRPGEVRIVEATNHAAFEFDPNMETLPFSMTAENVFILTETYILHRFFHATLQSRNEIYTGQAAAPTQQVRFVGVGPAGHMISDRARRLLTEAPHIILFDRTLENIVGEVAFRGKRHVLPFIYSDFAPNLLSLNLMLASLQADGVSNVTVIIEGNPEVYDYAEGLSTMSRSFTYEVSLPLVLIACQWIEISYNVALLHPTYILTSGFNVRQGVATNELLAELSDYLELDVTLVVMEMYCGDLPAVLGEISRSPTPKTILILTNMFSSSQKIYAVPFCDLGKTDVIVQLKAQFTTLVIVDDRRSSEFATGWRRILVDLRISC